MTARPKADGRRQGDPRAGRPERPSTPPGRSAAPTPANRSTAGDGARRETRLDEGAQKLLGGGLSASRPTRRSHRTRGILPGSDARTRGPPLLAATQAHHAPIGELGDVGVPPTLFGDLPRTDLVHLDAELTYGGNRVEEEPDGAPAHLRGPPGRLRHHDVRDQLEPHDHHPRQPAQADSSSPSERSASATAQRGRRRIAHRPARTARWLRTRRG